MEYTKEELLEAKRQIDSTLHKLRSTIVTLQGNSILEFYYLVVAISYKQW